MLVHIHPDLGPEHLCTRPEHPLCAWHCFLERQGRWRSQPRAGDRAHPYLWQCVLGQLHQHELSATVRDVVLRPVCRRCLTGGETRV
jgi:hypothetical protein